MARPKIAIVGVSALFPGSLDATGFWRDILAGTDLITDVPETHWLIEDYYDPDQTQPDKVYAHKGGFLEHVDFDAMGWACRRRWSRSPTPRSSSPSSSPSACWPTPRGARLASWTGTGCR